MPQDLPGFYYDAEKNRYFPIKGPIPGSSRNTYSTIAQKSTTESEQESKARKGLGTTTTKLLQIRELYGNVITSTKGKYNFREEYQKTQASEPMIWGYHGTERIADGALEQIHADINRAGGTIRTEILLAGGFSGSFCFSEVGKDVQQFHYGVTSMPHRVWPLNVEKQEGFAKSPGHLWRPAGASIHMQSNISCIKTLRKHSPDAADNDASMQHVLVFQ